MAAKDGPQYLIPKPTRRSYEVMPGWGLVEFGLIGAGAGIGAALFGLTGLLGLPIPVSAIAGILPVAVGGFLAFPPPAGEPMYRQVVAAKAYLSRPKRMLYDWGAGDE
jgi:hypothetical protein